MSSMGLCSRETVFHVRCDGAAVGRAEAGMSIFSRLLSNYKRSKSNYQSDDKHSKGNFFATVFEGVDEDFDRATAAPRSGDSYLYNAWVNIAVNILIRNVARADFVVSKGGNEVVSGPLYELFRRPNSRLSRYDLWKETAAWWSLEGEAFWWFGPEYAGGLPKELFVLNPRRLRHEEYHKGELHHSLMSKARRWFYDAGAELVPILSDELIHFRDWNPWNQERGVNPLAALALEQDYYANKANSQLLKNNAIPQGVLKTDQTLRPEEAEQLERRWESKYGAVKAGRKIAVLGKGTSFEPLRK
jgi:HK97 family phage portal protein